jgi:hypothetical protein
MKIAILSKFNYHYECFGFLLELYKSHSITFYISNDGDVYDWITYYKTLYPDFNIKIDKFKKVILKKYDLIFKLSSNDKCLCHSKIISILHKNALRFKCISNKYITLTPYIQSNDNITYIFPIFKPIVTYSTNNIITLIGDYKNDHMDDDTDKFIEQNQNYIFNFIIRINTRDPNYTNILKHPNVNILHNIKTPELVNIINSSKYILSKKYINIDRFSGQLGLSISFEKPLIIDTKTASVYNLPGIYFKKNYNEIGKLSDISDKQYNSIIKQIQKFKETTLTNNLNIINKFKNKI